MKKFIKNILQIVLPGLGFLITKTGKKNKVYKTISIKDKGVFFGYYDISPFSPDNSKILLNICNEKYFTSPGFNDYIDLAYYDLQSNAVKIFGKTKAWCWQQGCRLQFYQKSNNLVIYNSIRGDKFVSNVLNIETNQLIKQIDHPIYAVNSDGRYALTLNFARLQRLRPGYGYSVFPDNTLGSNHPVDDGIFFIDIEKEIANLIITLKDLFELETEETMLGAEHYVNHLLFSPDDEKFLFFHIWNLGEKRYSRPMIYDFRECRIKILDRNSHAVSHYTFKSKDELLLTIIDKELGLTYKLYDLTTGSIRILKNKHLYKDSHPSYIDENNLLFDTYPNIMRFSNLYVTNLSTDQRKKLNQNYHPIKFSGEYRCDLHPRLSHNNKLVCIDTIMEGKRVMKIIQNN